MADATGNILAVDDDRLNLMMLARTLKQSGHTVTTLTDGREALVLLRAQKFDVLILDCMMPEISGYELLEAVRADPALTELPVIMVSSVDDIASIVACVEMGATDYLHKPFDPSLLRARIKNTLEQTRAREQLRDNYERLRELESLRDNLIHMIVHDLRTPLTSVIGSLDALAVFAALEGENRELLDIARRGSDGLLAMINDLLDVRRLESEDAVLQRADVNLDRVVAMARDRVAVLAEHGGIRLESRVEPAAMAIHADADLLVRLLVNLLGNAIKFTPRGGEVALAACRPAGGKDIEIAVRDTGEGIPSAALPHIFDQFYQVKTRKRGRTMSTGLGLTFCKLVAEAHGGCIHVDSEPGQGSTFTVILPVTA